METELSLELLDISEQKRDDPFQDTHRRMKKIEMYQKGIKTTSQKPCGAKRSLE